MVCWRHGDRVDGSRPVINGRRRFRGDDEKIKEKLKVCEGNTTTPPPG